jgi:hypothetical protein
MVEFDAEAFVTQLDGLGLKLTAVPHADGKYRVYRWRTMDAVQHRQQIQDLWAFQIGDSQSRLEILAAHLAQKRSRETTAKAEDAPSHDVDTANPAKMERSEMDEPNLILCPECGGTGKVPLRLDNLPGPTPPLDIDCPKCGGTGQIRVLDESN